jgi:hypothetical protein
MTQQRSILELRLMGLPVADGEIPLAQLAELARHAQDLALRTARALVDAAGPGRTRRDVEASARLTLTAVTKGSTVLELAGPPRDQRLPLGDDFADLSDRVFDSIGEAFDRLVQGLAPETSGPALESLSGLLRAAALDDTELEVSTIVPGHERRRAHLQPTEAASIVEYALPSNRPEIVPAVVTGELYRVDTHSGRFRIEDDLGTSIEVLVAGEPSVVAGLVGRRVEVRGDAEYGQNSRLLRVGNAVVASSRPVVEPGRFTATLDLDELIAGAQPFHASEGGIHGVDADEIDAFLAAIRS